MSRCSCKGRAQGRHDMICEDILRSAFGSVGDAPADVLSLLAEHGRLVPGATVPGEIEGGNVKEGDKRRADQANAAVLESVGVDLMNCFNRDKTDPSMMATHGHDTSTGYEFFVERNGKVIKVELTRDLDS